MRSMLVCGAAACALLFPCALSSADPPDTGDADEALRLADRAGRRLLMLLDQSRRAHDVAQITCVDQSLSEVNSLSRALAGRRARLEAALASGDRAEVARLRRVVRTMAARVREAEREGRACVYPAAEENRTVVTVTVDPAIRHLDLSIPPIRR